MTYVRSRRPTHHLDSLRTENGRRASFFSINKNRYKVTHSLSELLRVAVRIIWFTCHILWPTTGMQVVGVICDEVRVLQSWSVQDLIEILVVESREFILFFSLQTLHNIKISTTKKIRSSTRHRKFAIYFYFISFINHPPLLLTHPSAHSLNPPIHPFLKPTSCTHSLHPYPWTRGEHDVRISSVLPQLPVV